MLTSKQGKVPLLYFKDILAYAFKLGLFDKDSFLLFAINIILIIAAVVVEVRGTTVREPT